MKELTEVLRDWEAVIGLEVHTELTTLNTKMFCSCKLSHDDEPNTNVCPVCLGFPGALPVPNQAAIESIVMAGLATECSIMPRSMFYRKNYFYPDMAKNFQTTQGPVAFCMDGKLRLDITGQGVAERVDREEQGPYSTTIGIERIHMEEDAAKMIHLGGDEGRITSAHESLVDYNRCGTPLIELVTRPDIRTPEEARSFMETLRQIFLTLGISDCSLESGSMRCDGNVSIRRRGEEKFGTKTELKNINSLRSLHDGLAYEICRQAEILEEGGTVRQETRHFEPATKRTTLLRSKETAEDYRLFPEPDLVPFDLSEDFIERQRARLPEFPQAKCKRFEEACGLRHDDAFVLASDTATSALFDEAYKLIDPVRAQSLANVMVNELAGYLKSESLSLGSIELPAEHLASLVNLLVEDAITSNQARDVLALMIEEQKDPNVIVDERGMRQVNDLSTLEPIVDEVIHLCEQQVEQYKNGQEKVIGFLIGQCMKRSRAAGNPKLFRELLEKALKA